MNSVVDAFTRRTAHIMRDVLTKLATKVETRVQVTYSSVGPLTINATAGTATSSVSSPAMWAWRGDVIEAEEPTIDTSTRQYVVLADDLTGAGVPNPARGDYITDGTAKYSIDSLAEGAVGADVIYYLFSCSFRSP